jgi:hypothetical protein
VEIEKSIKSPEGAQSTARKRFNGRKQPLRLAAENTTKNIFAAISVLKTPNS